MRTRRDEETRGLRTPSLRRRVTVLVLVLIGLMLLAVSVVTDVVLENRLDGQLRQRLTDRVSVAAALVDRVDPRDLARRLEGNGVSAVLTTSSGKVYAEGPLGGAATDGSFAGESAQSAGSVPSPGGGPAGSPRPGPADGPAATSPVVRNDNLLSVTQTLSTGTTVTLLADATDVSRTLGQVRLALLLAALVVLLGASVAVPPVVARALRPLDRITDIARTITDGDRGRRLRPVQPGTELGRTAVAFDDMLDAVVGAEDRSRRSEQRLREFLSDAAHELRTPVAGVQVAAEHLLRDDPPKDDREQTLIGLVRESRRTGRLVDDMLMMARIDQGLALGQDELDLRTLVGEVLTARALAHPGLELSLAGIESAPVRGDRDRLTQVVGNLLDNAARAARSRVCLELGLADDRVELTVGDDGPGVPVDQRERIFERLVRLDDSRTTTPHPGGAGLGLSIARGIARAHGGDLVCTTPPGGVPGARFVLSLPSAEPEPATAG